MNCILCEQQGTRGVALYQVGKKGFCRAHKAEAYEAEAKNNKQRDKAQTKAQTIDLLDVRGGGHKARDFKEGRVPSYTNPGVDRRFNPS